MKPEPVTVRPDDSTIGTTSKEQNNGSRILGNTP